MTAAVHAPPCLLCTMEDADRHATVFRDDHWAAEIVPGYEVPGWYILRVRRHAERITGLNDDELDGFAWRARDLVAAVTSVTGAPATYLMVFGENYAHFHALIAPRGEEIPVHHRGGNLLQLRTELADPVAAAELLPAVREAFTAISAAGVGRRRT